MLSARRMPYKAKLPGGKKRRFRSSAAGQGDFASRGRVGHAGRIATQRRQHKKWNIKETYKTN